MSYDNWRTTDPADADPYRDTDCAHCGQREGYRCAPECDCPSCVDAIERDERQKGDDDGVEYADPGDYLRGWE